MDDASTLVPNAFTTAQKVLWLNDLNRIFFETVKIGKVSPFNALSGVSDYILTTDVALRNIDRVVVGTAIYRSLQLEDVPPGNNGWTFNETNATLTLSPPPPYATPAYVRYMQTPVTVFTTTTPTGQIPDAPLAFHDTYVLGLAERMALSLDDIAKSSNFGQQYRSLLNVAQANYLRGVAL